MSRIISLLLLLAAAVRAGDVAPYNVVWDSPSRDWNGSMPIGNGDLAANVWVEPSGDLVVLPSKSDAMDANSRLLKLGQLMLRMDPPLVTTNAPFRQELDLATGTIVIQAGRPGDAASLSLWIDANNPLVRIEVQSDRPRKVSLEHETWRTERMETTAEDWSTFAITRRGLNWKGQHLWVEPDVVLSGQTDRVVFYHRNEHSVWADDLEGLNLSGWTQQAQDPLQHLTFGALVQADGMRNAGPQRLETTAPRKTLAIAITAHCAITPTPEQWLKELETKAAGVTTLEPARKAHRQWWADFWARSWIDIRENQTIPGGGVAPAGIAYDVSQAYALQRWITACAGRGRQPIRFNGSLFTVRDRDAGMLADGKGPLHDHDYRRHGPLLWWQNTRHAYWPLLDSGDFEMMRPLFDTYAAMLPLRRFITRSWFQHDGAFYDETIYPWGAMTTLNYGTGPIRNGKAVDWCRTPDIRYYWQGGLELTAMMIRYYDYTGDRAFLRDTLLPFAHEIVTFYDQHYKRDAAGRILFAPANALEDIWNCKNPAPEIAGLKANLTALAKLTDDATQKAMYARMLTELPELPAAVDQDGKRRLLPCLPGWDKRKNNTEKPDLYVLFPHLLYGIGRPDLEAAVESWKIAPKKYGGTIKPLCWNQDSIFLACMGMTDAAKREIVARAHNKYRRSRFPAFWAPNFDWVPDQDHGGVAMVALQKMLMQPDLPCNSGKIWLLPAWPKEWDVHFKVHAPFETTVECEVRGGQVIRLAVMPESRRRDVEICPPFTLETSAATVLDTAAATPGGR